VLFAEAQCSGIFSQLLHTLVGRLKEISVKVQSSGDEEDQALLKALKKKIKEMLKELAEKYGI
jgi:hypothetical protein